MTLPSSFPLSMSQVATELGTNLPLSLLDPRVVSLAGKSGPPVSFSDLLGKTAPPPGTQYSFNMLAGSGAGGIGWNFTQFGTLTPELVAGNTVNMFKDNENGDFCVEVNTGGGSPASWLGGAIINGQTFFASAASFSQPLGYPRWTWVGQNAGLVAGNTYNPCYLYVVG